MEKPVGDFARPIGSKRAPSHRTSHLRWPYARNLLFFARLEIHVSIRKSNNRGVPRFCILKNPTPSATPLVAHFCVSFVLLISSWTYLFGTTLNHFSASAFVTKPL